MYAEIYHNGNAQLVAYAKDIHQLKSNLQDTLVLQYENPLLKTLAIIKLKSWKTKS